MAVEHDLDVVEDLQRAEQRRVGLHAPAVCVTTAVALSAPSSPTARSKAIGWRRARERQVALDARARLPPARALHPGRAERDVLALEHLVVDRLVDARLVVVAERLDPAACPPGRAARWRRRSSSTLVAPASAPTSSVALPRGHVDEQVVPGLGRRPAASRVHRERRVARARAGTCLARSRTRRAYIGRTRNRSGTDGRRAGALASRPRSRSTRASRRSPTSSAWCRPSRAAACSRRRARTRSRPRSSCGWARCR